MPFEQVLDDVSDTVRARIARVPLSLRCFALSLADVYVACGSSI